MSGRFEPKTPVNLNPPKDDPISVDYLAKCDGKWKYPAEERFGGTAVDSGAQEHWLTELLGSSDEYPTLVAIKGKVFDVTGNKAYSPSGGYKVFAGHDASRALAKTSLKVEDISPEWQDLPESEKNTLNDWYTFFSKRYNIVGVVEGATNME